MFSFFKRKQQNKDIAYQLFNQIVDQSRQVQFYERWQVEDSLDGRFDILTLHMVLLLLRIEKEEEGAKTNKGNRDLFLIKRYVQEVFFDNMDLSLREMGVGDMSVGKKVKIMAEAFYGRKAAYKESMLQGLNRALLSQAVINNVFRAKDVDEASVKGLVDYFIDQHEYVQTLSCEHIVGMKKIFR